MSPIRRARPAPPRPCRACTVLTIVAMATVLPNATSRAQMPALASRFPEQTLLFTHLNDATRFRGQWKQTSLGQLWESPAFAPFRQQLATAGDGPTQLIRKRFGVAPDELLKVAEGRMAMGAVEGPDKELTFVFLVEHGRDAKPVDELLANAGRDLLKRGAKLNPNHGLRETLVYDLPAQGDQAVLSRHDGFLLLSERPRITEQILAQWNAPEPIGLATVAAFKEALQRTAGDGPADLCWFADVIQLATVTDDRTSSPDIPADQWKPFAQRHGFPAIRGVGGQGWLPADKFDFVNRVAVVTNPPLAGAMKIFEFPNGDAAVAPFVPREASTWSSLQWNLLAMFRNIGPLYDDITDAPGAWRDFVDGVSSDLRVELDDDLFALLAEEITVFGLYEQGGAARGGSGGDIERTAVAVRIKSDQQSGKQGTAQRVDRMLYRLLIEDANAVRRPVRGARGNHYVWRVRLLTGDERTAFSTAGLTVLDGYLWISTHASLLTDLVQRRLDGKLSEHQDYQAFAQKMQDHWTKDKALRSYIRLDRDVRNTYEILRTRGIKGLESSETLYGNLILQLLKLSTERPNLDYSLLPPFEKVAKHFGIAGIAGKSVERGWDLTFVIDKAARD